MERAPSSVFLLPGRGVCPYFALRVFFAVQGCVHTRSVDSPAPRHAPRFLFPLITHPPTPSQRKAPRLVAKGRSRHESEHPSTSDAAHGGRLPSPSRVCASLAHPLPRPPPSASSSSSLRCPLLRCAITLLPHHRILAPVLASTAACTTPLPFVDGSDPARLGGTGTSSPGAHLVRRHAQPVRLCLLLLRRAMAFASSSCASPPSCRPLVVVRPPPPRRAGGPSSSSSSSSPPPLPPLASTRVGWRPRTGVPATWHRSTPSTGRSLAICLPRAAARHARVDRIRIAATTSRTWLSTAGKTHAIAATTPPLHRDGGEAARRISPSSAVAPSIRSRRRPSALLVHQRHRI